MSARRQYSKPPYDKEGFPTYSGSTGAYTPLDPKSTAPAHLQEKRSQKKKGRVWRVIFWLALIVFLASLSVLAYIGYGYYSLNKAYEDIALEALDTPVDIEQSSLADIRVDWNALLAVNPDTVGWIYVPGTNINYPIVQTGNNEKYLKTDFFGEQSYPSGGAIFLDMNNSPDFSNANNVIYGHNMLDGSMFESIDYLREQEEFDEHRIVYILTPRGNYLLNTFSIIVTSGDDPLAQTSFSSDEDMQQYIKDKLGRSEVRAPEDIPDPAEMGKIFTLSTCSYVISDGRAVLFAYVADSVLFADTDDSADGAFINPEDIDTVGEASKELA